MFEGSLETLPVLDLVKLLNLQEESGVLTLSDAAGQGRLFLTVGEVVSASFREADRDGKESATEGLSAMTSLLSLQRGAFRFEPGPPSVTRTIPHRVWVLLLEKLRELQLTKGTCLLEPAAGDPVGEHARMPAPREPSPPLFAGQFATLADRLDSGPILPPVVQAPLRRATTRWSAKLSAALRPHGAAVSALVRSRGATVARLVERLRATHGRTPSAPLMVRWLAAVTTGVQLPVPAARLDAAARSRETLRRQRTVVFAASATTFAAIVVASTLVVADAVRAPEPALDSAELRSLRLKNAENRAKLENLQTLLQDLSGSIATGSIAERAAAPGAAPGSATGAIAPAEQRNAPPAVEVVVPRAPAREPAAPGAASTPVERSAAPPQTHSKLSAGNRVQSDVAPEAVLIKPGAKEPGVVAPTLSATRYPRGLLERKSRRLNIVLSWTDRYAKRDPIPNARFRVLVNPSGTVAAARVVRSSGLAELDKLAASALLSASYKPAYRNGSAVPAWVQEEVAFRNR